MTAGHTRLGITAGVGLKVKAILNLLYARFPDKQGDFTVDDLLQVVNPARSGIWNAKGEFDPNRFGQVAAIACISDAKSKRTGKPTKSMHPETSKPTKSTDSAETDESDAKGKTSDAKSAGAKSLASSKKSPDAVPGRESNESTAAAGVHSADAKNGSGAGAGTGMAARRSDFKPVLSERAKGTGEATKVYGVLPVTWKAVTSGSFDELCVYFGDSVAADGADAVSPGRLHEFYTDPDATFERRARKVARDAAAAVAAKSPSSGHCVIG